MSDNPTPPAAPVTFTRTGKLYEPAVGPKLRVVLAVLFLATALLGTTGVYLFVIGVMEWRGETYTNQFTLWMFIAHVLVGVAIAVPFLAFGLTHWFSARHRRNRVAVRLGLALFAVGILAVLSGLALIQLERLPQLPTGTLGRRLVY